MDGIIFVANDSGGARLLAPLIREVTAAGHAVRVLASGPAEAMWSELEVSRDAAAHDRVEWLVDYLAAHRPDLMVTGTSHFSDLERNAWVAARRLGIRSVAAIDAWVNFPERFVRNDGEFVQPDHVCVIDDGSRERLQSDRRIEAQIHVCGQPHLESLVTSLVGARRARGPADPARLVFFSNPVFVDLPPEERPYDQFKAASVLFAALRGTEGCELLIKPHPREAVDPWQKWVASVEGDVPAVTTTQAKADDLLVSCDGACGITSMSLVEASLLGRPVLSLQPGRRRAHNPVIDELPGVNLAASEAEAPAAVKAWLGQIQRRQSAPPAVPAAIVGSRQHYMTLFNELLSGR